MKILIAHAAWDESRRAHVAKMLDRLPNAWVVSSYVREPARIWFRRVLESAEGEPFCMLNDDVDTCDDFEAVVEQLVKVAPDRMMIALHATAPVAPSLMMCGERWLESFWMTGPGMIIRNPQALLDWIDSLPGWVWAGDNEDGVCAHYAWSRREPILHCLPAIVRHRTDIKSTLGYDGHPMRSSDVYEQSPTEWPAPMTPLLVGCPWKPLEALKRTEAAIRSHVDLSPEPRVAFASPSKGGSYTEEYVASLWKTALHVQGGELKWIKLRWALDSVDIIRARARFQDFFLTQTDCTELLWVDDDHAWEPSIIAGLVHECRSGKDLIFAPYPQKHVHWERVRKAVETGRHPETFTSDYPIHFLKNPENDGNCLTVGSAGMGMCCLSRRAVAALHDEAMLHPVESGEWFTDYPASHRRIANTFGFKVDPKTGHLLSDSHTLCWRWKQLKGKLPFADGRIWLYCGPGAPISHVGKHVFHGYPEGVVGDVVE